MKIADRTIAPDQPPYVIAEIGVNHDGSVEQGGKIAEAAAHAGADAIKLQFFQAARLLSRAAQLAEYQRTAGARDPMQMVAGLELSIDEMQEIAACALAHCLHVIVTVFSIELIDAAETLDVAAYKTASPDLINRPLLDALMQTGRPLLVSAGAATADEVAQATVWLGRHPHVMMQCVSSYPTPEEHAALDGRKAMEAINRSALGYSDHTTTVDAGALAVAGGARLLEKHITLDRSAPGPDHAASLDPKQFAEYVRLAHRAWKMCGPAEKRLLEIEQDVRSVSRQSVTTVRALPAGHEITRDDLTIKRPGTGIEPRCMESLIGRRTAHDVEANAPLREDDLS